MKFARVAVEVNINRIFTYSVPENLEQAVMPGMRVRVPFRKREIGGYVVALTDEPVNDARMITSLTDGFPVISASMLELGKWLSGYYLCAPGEVLKGMMPGGVKLSRENKVSGGSVKESPLAGDYHWLMPLEKSLCAGEHEVYLLKGIDGDDVYDAYMRMSMVSRRLGRQTIILVPDIVSLGRIEKTFMKEFGDDVRVFHSGLPAGRRRSAWTDINTGRVSVVLGLRSAVFAPAHNTGLIIVDREYDFSYKQKQNPRYNAVDTALRRGMIEGCPVVLQGSFPSFETNWKVRTEKFRLLDYGWRGKKTYPAVRIVDMRNERSGIISRNLRNEIINALIEKKRVMLFMERRGHSNFLICRACGYVARCENCSVALRYHAAGDRLICHYCRHMEKAQNLCSNCGKGYLRKSGFGTQQVEALARKLFPRARVGRVDSDVGAVKDEDLKLIDGFKRGDIDILIGTRIALKFGGFENVSTAGIISAESFLNMPDFRSAENMFRFAWRLYECIKGSSSLIIQTYNPGHYAMKCIRNFDADGFFREESVTRKKLKYPPFGHLSNIILSGETEKEVEACAGNLAGLMRERFKDEVDVLGPVPAALSKLRGRFRWQVVLKSGTWEDTALELGEILREAEEKKTLKKNIKLAIDVDALDML